MNKLLFLFGIFTVILNYHCESRQISRTPANYKQGVKEEILTAIQRCNIGEKLPEMIKLVREGSYNEDELFKKFIYCGFKEAGYSLENGRINLDRAYQAFEGKYEDMEKVMRDCDKPFGDPATNTFEYFKCFQDNTPYLLQL